MYVEAKIYIPIYIHINKYVYTTILLPTCPVATIVHSTVQSTPLQLHCTHSPHNIHTVHPLVCASMCLCVHMSITITVACHNDTTSPLTSPSPSPLCFTVLSVVAVIIISRQLRWHFVIIVFVIALFRSYISKQPAHPLPYDLHYLLLQCFLLLPYSTFASRLVPF